MVNKPKAIGTAAETAVLRKILPYFPQASRNALYGNADRGDIGHAGDFIFEVKGGKQTQLIGDQKLQSWMNQTDVERDNSKVRWGILVVQRSGVGGPNAHRWWAYVHLGDLAQWCRGDYRPGPPSYIRLELGQLLDLLADHGFTESWPASMDELAERTMSDIHATP